MIRFETQILEGQVWMMVINEKKTGKGKREKEERDKG